jgi:multiple sugar transport system permease protein
MTTTAPPRRYRPPAQLGGRRPEARGPEQRRPELRRADARRSAKAFAFLAPALLILLAFVFLPAVDALFTSFTDASGFGSPNWVGLQNYIDALGSGVVLQALLNTILYAAMYAPGVILVGLGAALLLNREDLPLRGFFRTAIFLPFVISMAVASIAWSFLLDPNLGLVTYWLSLIGIHIGNIFGTAATALPAVTAVAVWKNFGYFMVIFLAGLQSVPRHLYEAARLDGAGRWRTFRAVTLPGLRSTMTFVIILALIGAFQAFDQIYIMTQGGPDHATQTIVYRIYTDGFRDFKLGFASALSYLLLIITLILGLIQLRLNARQEGDLE